MDYIQDIRPTRDLPYPNLIKYYATANQHAYFMEPKDPIFLRRTHEEKAAENAIVRKYPGFGSLSHVYRQERQGKGFHQLVFFRRDRGTVDHGLGRSNEDVYECAKMNVLRHPRENDHSNSNYREARPKSVTGFDRAMLDLANYPFLARSVMSAPLLPRCSPLSKADMKGKAQIEGKFSLPRSTQPSALTRVFQTPELCLHFIETIGDRWADMSNFSRSCQMVLYALNEVAARVDTTRGNFLNLEFTDKEINEANAGEDSAVVQQKGEFLKPSPPTFLMVSNVRRSYEGAEDGEDEPLKFGYPAKPKGWYFTPSAARRVIDTYKLSKSTWYKRLCTYTNRHIVKCIDVRGHQIKVLHLHSTPNVDVAVVRMFLESLPNLKVLGVHNCELLHFGTTIPMLKMIIEHNETKGKKFVRTDFSPFYYHGIQRQSDGRRGEYGVIPSDHGLIDTRRGIVAVLRIAVPLALKNGIDWFTPGTGMRQFLDRFPFALGTIRYILEALYNLYYEDIAPAEGAYADMMRRALNNDLILAVNGGCMDKDTLYATTSGTTGQFTPVECAYCHAKLPSYFFTTRSISRHWSQIECVGCQLCTNLDLHVDDFYQERRKVLEILFDRGQIRTIDEFINGTRTATAQEICNPEFPFFLTAVKSIKDILAASGKKKRGLVLGLRPGPKLPERVKKIWLWRERTFLAMKYARTHVDRGFIKLRPIFKRAFLRIRNLDAEYETGLSSQSRIQENRDERDRIRRYIDQEYARCGLRQMGGVYDTRVASDWDSVIENYRQTVQVACGVIRDNGPYNTVWNTAPTGFW
ncbi:uncharacterized protein F4822DRAFT_426005 [Hypoxylon trugodes]|uniref:uncharacterized protein n=1 Tax=Hypoxylon trugodes TaxID=326681 RepID=UPI002195573C|nr:uncharacterized protein F4822DRAFT_426005 [Hypoxylon trugodes]KAI1392798.1 hypothetical protein F4822DRAFT_426005 [Hypoxylon trugodes]